MSLLLNLPTHPSPFTPSHRPNTDLHFPFPPPLSLHPFQFTDTRTKDVKWFQQEFTKLELELITNEDRADTLERAAVRARRRANPVELSLQKMQTCEPLWGVA